MAFVFRIVQPYAEDVLPFAAAKSSRSYATWLLACF
jgi:hypothetical protein